MSYMVPYQSNGSARAMMSRALTTVGTRASGRMALPPPPRVGLRGLGCGCSTGLGGGGGRSPAPGPGLEYDTDAALPLVPYEAAKRMGFGGLGGSTTAGAAKGASVGASVGSAIPVVGTAIGAILGGIGGAIASAFSRQDAEVANFDQAQAIAKANGPQAVVNIANKYLALAGLFDLQPGQIKGNIPFYKQYGRMGEQKFITDMMTRIYQAAQNRQITTNDTPQSIYSNIVLPWMNSWGKGSLQDSNQDMITWMLLGMIAEYVAGYQTRWYARGGQFAFPSLPAFSLPAPPPPAVLPPPAAPTAVVHTCPTNYLWNGTQCVSPILPTAQPQIPQAPTTVSPAAPVPLPARITLNDPTAAAPPVSAVPSGFNMVGHDANGAPIFSNPQGVLYSWNGSGMVQFTGAVASGSSVAAQVQAAIQTALAQGYTPAQAAQQAVASTQAQGIAVPPAIQTQAFDQAAVAASAPQASAAGFGGGLGGTVGLLAIGATLVGLIFATARPMSGPRPRGRRYA